ncbi:hypothetical protein QJS10_CPA07g00923 [Acorus calamus]|uniref:Uncharacterized protein n=1 Tax=Acorus calamus TaxID=4465 RepID=A0AAV9EHZ5_ACOCL|nr:hypothetical protein QJS10_CPA07g00923 [Acorus calamus]
MVFFMLYVSAELDKLTDIQPEGGCDDPNFVYLFKLRCENCGELTQKETCVVLGETVPLTNGRGTANLVQKCKFCGREGTIQMIPGQGRPLTLETSQSGGSAPVMLFECRGFEPVDYVFGDGWKAESTEGTKFNMDLSDGEFSEYDEKGEFPVEITNLRGTFKVVHEANHWGKTVYQ